MHTILVVDDSATDRRLVAGLLEGDAQLRPLFAANGREALERIKQGLPDLVLTDLIMPEMDGLELVGEVRRSYPLVPTVLMTSRGSEEIAVEALRRGAASYVPKRVLADELLGTLHDVLAAAGRRRTESTLMGCLRQCRYDFRLANDRYLLSSLVGYLQEAVGQLGVCDDADRTRIGIALEEALVNALYHGNLELSSELKEGDGREYQRLAEERTLRPPYCERRIHVAAHLDGDEATFVIRDEGPGFDPESLPDPTDPANLEKVSGRGILLMRTFMDEVIYNPRGNEVTLKKRRRTEG